MQRSRSILLLSALALTGCPESSTPGGGGVPLEDVPEEFAGAICDNLFRCLGSLSDLFGTTESCVDAFGGAAANNQLPQWQALIERGTITYDGDAVRACLDASRARGCGGADDPPPAECGAIFIGTVPLGGACSLSEECEGEAYCADADCPTTPGVCTARSAGGGSCRVNDHCESGLACEDGTCVIPTSNRGGPCMRQDDCPLDEMCVGADGETPGTCTDRASLETAGLGEPCNLIDGDVVLCADGVSCAIMGFTPPMNVEQSCVADVGSGGTCFLALPSMCPSGEYCAGADPMMLMFEGTCTPLPGDGEPCATTVVGQACAAGATCIDGTCRTQRANGAACTLDEECYSGRCADGVCAAPELCRAG